MALATSFLNDYESVGLAGVRTRYRGKWLDEDLNELPRFIRGFRGRSAEPLDINSDLGKELIMTEILLGFAQDNSNHQGTAVGAHHIELLNAEGVWEPGAYVVIAGSGTIEVAGIVSEAKLAKSPISHPELSDSGPPAPPNRDPAAIALATSFLSDYQTLGLAEVRSRYAGPWLNQHLEEAPKFIRGFQGRRAELLQPNTDLEKQFVTIELATRMGQNGSLSQGTVVAGRQIELLNAAGGWERGTYFVVAEPRMIDFIWLATEDAPYSFGRFTHWTSSER